MNRKRQKNPRRQRRRSSSPAASVERIDIRISELEAIIDRAQAEPLSEQEVATLQSAVKTLLFVTEELEKKRVSVKRLKQLLFGASTEKLKNVLEEALGQDDKDKEPQDSQSDTSGQDKPKPKGHGRNGADAYTGAEKVNISHDTLQPGDRCRACKQGSVYETATPGRLVRVTGQAPVHATVYKLQKLRCNLCGKIFTAKPPENVGEDKYDAESVSMIALLKYGSGMPFNRLERLQGSLGIPLPAATQWDILTDGLPLFVPIHEALIRAAAQGQVLHNDDTGMKVLSLTSLNKPGRADSDEQKPSQRQGVFTSGIVSVDAGHRIALYFTSHQHAGENLAEVLKHRADELAPPIQMCDALSRNMSEDLKAIVANCLAHGRRRFVEVAANFPDECLYVLEILKDVYQNDAEAKQRGFSDEQRLAWHQAQSGPKMAELETWLTEQIEQHQVEPNSSLGEAISYMRTHWEPLTLFLRQPGAPLDNNICERALKKAILHRKNAYFYKTENGAYVGDLFMSLIHTCELNEVNPFDYLTQVQKHAAAVALSPADWMPWTYRQTLALSQTPANA